MTTALPWNIGVSTTRGGVLYPSAHKTAAGRTFVAVVPRPLGLWRNSRHAISAGQPPLPRTPICATEPRRRPRSCRAVGGLKEGFASLPALVIASPVADGQPEGPSSPQENGWLSKNGERIHSPPTFCMKQGFPKKAWHAPSHEIMYGHMEHFFPKNHAISCNQL